ncbi:hypothetical protein Mlute_02563 [Meiothermus luteus]|uniref:Uncharacterized protein n=1 Tax=Meiothermus luteus TaxID=2026184 RepID=A0A399EGL9_9DEIN|nr:hypothetical protein Mlute_02563 [Meiothermus luteus]
MHLGGSSPGLQKSLDALEEPVLHRALLLALFGFGPVHPGPMQPAVVAPVGRFFYVVVVVEQAQLVAHVDERDALAIADEDCMGQQQALNGQVDQPGIARLQGGLEPPQAGRSARGAPVAGGGVFLEVHPPGKGAREVALVKLRQKVPVGRAGEPYCGGVGVGDGPADVVVAAQVGGPGRAGGFLRKALQGLGKKPGVAAGQAAPDLHHQGVVVGQLRDLAVVSPGAQVGNQVLGGHDGLGLEGHRRGPDAHRRPHGLGESVHLGLVLAVGAQALPDEGNGV